MHIPKYRGLDHLRSLAIIMVVVYHYRMFNHPEWVDTYGRFGWTGVDLFFVLSGFLISQKLFQEIKSFQTVDLKKFYIKRFFRIIPPYAVTLILYFCFSFYREREALPPLWKFITFTQNIGLDLINFGTFSHAWSLCIEEQFYLFFPILLLFFIKYNKMQYFVYQLLFMLLLTIVLREFSWHDVINNYSHTNDFWKMWYMKIYYPTYTRLDGLIVGISIAFFYEHTHQFKKCIDANGNFLLVAGLIMLGFSFWLCDSQTSHTASVLGFTVVSISCGLLVMSAISASSFLYHLKSNLSSQLAALSYSVYLTHKGIIHITQSFTEHLNIDKQSNFTLFICLLFCILTGFVFRYLIEKPSNSIKSYFLKNKNK